MEMSFYIGSVARLRQFALYTVAFNESGANWKVLFAGACPVEEMLLIHSARDNSEWRSMVQPSQAIKIEAAQFFDNSTDARNALDAYVRQHAPRFNVIGVENPTNRTRRRVPIRCIDDGREFESAAAACKFYDISSSTMSNHMQRKKNYGTAAGRRFEYV